MLRILLIPFVVCLFGCSAAPVDLEKARKSLLASTLQVRQAMLQPDHQLMAELTLPIVVEGMGGREQFTKRLAEISAEMEAGGFKMTDLVLSDPSELVVSKGNVYAIAPYTVHLTAPANGIGSKLSYLICLSTDSGASWKFIDGEGIAGDRAKLLQVIPDFPEQLTLPPTKSPQWKP